VVEQELLVKQGVDATNGLQQQVVIAQLKIGGETHRVRHVMRNQ
jgi:hypothetical protein